MTIVHLFSRLTLDIDKDPVTQKQDVLCLESLHSLSHIEVRNIGEKKAREKEDLRTLREVMESWQPGLTLRHLHLHIMATALPINREKAEFLTLVEQIAQIVEEGCSGTGLCSVFDFIHVTFMLLS